MNYLLVYRLTDEEGRREPRSLAFATRYEALDALDALLREHQELCSVEIIRRSR